MILTKCRKIWHWIVAAVAIPVALAALPADELDTLEKIRIAEEIYYQAYGKYLQILPNNRLPSDEVGTVKEKVGKDVKSDWSVNTYVTPKKEWGYIVNWYDADNEYVSDSGLEPYRNRVIPRPPLIASTTGFRWPDLEWPDWSFLNSALALTTNTNSTDEEVDDLDSWTVADGGTASTTDLKPPMTLSIWYRSESNPGAGVEHYLIGKSNANVGSNRAYYLAVATGIDAGGNSIVFFNNSTGDGANNIRTYWPYTVTTGVWTHFVLRYSTSTDVKLLIDGVDQGMHTNNANQGLRDSTAAFSIGQVNETNAIDGLVDDVRIWSRALSTTSAQALFNTPCDDSTNGANLQGWWLFDNNGLDNGVNDLDLTHNGGAAVFSTTVAYTCAAGGVPPTGQDFWFFNE